MGGGTRYELIAFAASGDGAAHGDIARRLSQAFGIAVTPQELHGGRVVLADASADPLRARAGDVLAAGASYRLVDENGVLHATEHAKAAQAAPASASKTVFGLGPQAIAAMQPGAPESAAVAATQVMPASDASSAQLVPTPSQPEAAGPIEPTPSDGLDLDKLDMSALVALDGSSEEAERGPGAEAFAPPGQQASEPQFAPSAADAALEIDDVRAGHVMQAAEPISTAYDDPGSALALDLPAEAQPAPLNNQVPIDDSYSPLSLDTEAFGPQGDVSPPSLPGSPPAPPLPAMPPLAPSPSQLNTQRPAAAPRNTPPPGTTRHAGMARAGGARKSTRLADFRLMDGRLQQWPRLRIVGGFAFALILGSILPMCHARSVVRNKVAPARQQLARVKAYGSQLVGKPGYRAPEEWEAHISSTKSRGGLLTIIIWMVTSGLLGAAWFRFT